MSSFVSFEAAMRRATKEFRKDFEGAMDGSPAMKIYTSGDLEASVAVFVVPGELAEKIRAVINAEYGAGEESMGHINQNDEDGE